VHFQGLNLELSSSSLGLLIGGAEQTWPSGMCLYVSLSLSVDESAWVLVESRLTDGAALQDTICAAIVPECEH
jgi:hypothetical protein